MVTLPEGVVDFQANTPPRDTLLLAPAATLVAKKDLHPALIDLLLIAATEVHSAGGIFEEPNEPFTAPHKNAIIAAGRLRNATKASGP